MPRRLKVDQGDIKNIADELKCSSHYVSIALKGGVSTVLSRKIRALAIAKYKARVLKECELTLEERLEELEIKHEYGMARE